MSPLSVLLDFGLEEGGPRSVGRLAGKDKRVFFEFDPEFLASPLPISPFRLSPRSGVIEGPIAPFEGLPGLFADSLPDAWGRLLMDRALRRSGVDPAQLTILDTLAMVGTGGAGALTFHPERSVEQLQDQVDLDGLAKDATAVLAGDVDEVDLDRWRRLGGSSGGARPKALLYLDPATDTLHATDGVGRESWIVKFTSGIDGPDAGPIEAAYAILAVQAGLQMSETRLFPSADGPGYFGTRRFDRPMHGARRLHLQSLSGLLEADYRLPSVGYDAFVKAARMLTRREVDAEAAFRLMVFNIAVHNRDDHAKNVAFLMDANGEWRLAPAFDLTFAEGPGGEHTMDVLGQGRAPNREGVLALAAATSIRSPIAATIIDEVCDALIGATALLRKAGVRSVTARKIGGAIEEGRSRLRV